MEQFYNKIVRYLGETKEKFNLEHGKEYEVTHTIGNRVGLLIRKTENGRLLVSVDSSKVEIIGVKDSTVIPYSVLLYENRPVGLRFQEKEHFYDVELDALKGFDIKRLKGFKTQSLILHGDVLVTEEEVSRNFLVTDKSSDKNFVQLVKSFF